uniref:Bcl-x interacting BH3 domain-containing protein n=1 Tax=Scleropages formosus TaxID=113540 RepID=A0A8C9VIN6_SCLFO
PLFARRKCCSQQFAADNGRQTRANGPTTLSESGEGREAQPGRGDQARAVVVPSDSRAGAQARAPRFSALSTSSSGYHSLDYDSLPSSPLMTDNKATQTPSPSSQAIAHAQERISRAHDALPDDEMQPALNRFRPRSLSMPVDMRPEVLVAQELRRIGDELNNLVNGWSSGSSLIALQPQGPGLPPIVLSIKELTMNRWSKVYPVVLNE